MREGEAERGQEREPEQEGEEEGGRERQSKRREREESCSLIELFTRLQRHLESSQPLLSVLIV